MKEIKLQFDRTTLNGQKIYNVFIDRQGEESFIAKYNKTKKVIRCLRRKRNLMRKYNAHSFAFPLINELDFKVLKLQIEDDVNYQNKILSITKKDLLKKAIKEEVSFYGLQYYVPLECFNETFLK